VKFIKNIRGDFIRVDKIVALEVYKTKSPDEWVVIALLENHGTTLKQFGTEAEDRSWLNEFVIQLEDELSGRNLTRNVWEQVSQLINGTRHADTH